MANGEGQQQQNRFLVPQYIDTEPKILGPITVRQFILMLASGLLGFIFWTIFQNINQLAGIGLIVFQFMIFAIFAFAVINGQKFHYFVLNLIQTTKKPKLRVWKKQILKEIKKEEEEEEDTKIPDKRLPPKSRLSDLSLMVDTGGAYNIDIRGDQQTGESGEEAGVEDMNI